MEDCAYNELRGKNSSSFSWKHFLRQLLLCSGIWMTYFMMGLSLGAPTVFIPQIRKERNSTEAISEEMASWLSSITGYAGLPWVFILPVLTHYVGRKIPFIILSITSSMSFFVFYFSNSPVHLLISSIMQGLILTCHHTVTPVIVTEYTSPQFRGIFLTIKSASIYWGIWISNAIGTFYHWRYIGLCGIICSVYTLTVIVWPESPIWYASKGRYDDCVQSHRWLKGVDTRSEKELSILIDTHKKIVKIKSEINLHQLWKTIRSREFYFPITLCVLMMSLYHLSGKMACSMYAIEIIKKMTDSESTAYKGMLILDGVTVLSMYSGCIISKFLKRRTLLLCSSSLGALFLFLISIFLYLVELKVTVENKVVSIVLLTLFSVTISCGPMILSTSIYGELIPHKYKTTCMILIGLFSDAIMATVLKISPYIFKSFGLHGAFLFYGISVTICLLILYKYLPETKDKTVQEIESMIKNVKKPQAKGIELMYVA